MGAGATRQHAMLLLHSPEALIVLTPLIISNAA